MICLLLTLLALLAFPPTGTAQERRNEIAADDATFAGYDMIGLYGGGNASLLSIRSGMLFWLPNGYSVDDPAGFGYDVAVIWARQMPNLFLTRPSSPAERDDPSRSYRRFTTFEVRLSYSRLGGRGGIHDVARNAVGTSSLDYRFDVVAIEPRLAFDFGPMSSPSSGRFTLGGVLGHIAAARFASAADITAPEASAPPEEFRDFYGAMLLGFGGRIGFGSNGHDAAALVPCVDLLIPLTSISIGSTWLPFSVRLGLGIQWPI